MTMEDISQEMAHRPRYWQRLMTVLAQTIRGKETPGIIIQVRSIHLFIHLYVNPSICSSIHPLL